MCSSPRCCAPIYPVQMCSCIFTWRAAGVMHHRQTKGNEAALAITHSSTLKNTLICLVSFHPRWCHFFWGGGWCHFLGGRGLIRGRVCGSAGVIKNKSRLDHMLILACQVTERSQLCAGNMTPRQGHWHAHIHTTAFKRWCGQQRPHVWMTATSSWRARRPTSCLL